MRCERWSPPTRLALVAPLSRHSLTKRTALETEIPNRSAAARRDIPPSTARTTLIRKSSDKGLAMRAGLLAPARSVNQNSPSLEIPHDSNRSDFALAALIRKNYQPL